MKKDWLIVLSVVLVSCVFLYVFNPWRAQTKPIAPQPEVVTPPDVKPPEIPKPEVKEPEVINPKVPDVVVFESTKGKVTFNHSAHAEAYTCKDCHHKTEEGSNPQKCKTCHEKPFTAFHNQSSTYSCVGCHKQAGAGPGYTPCSGCHKK